MSKIFLIASFCAIALAGCKTPQSTDTSALSAGDNSQTSLDWQGMYTGILPCADCEGIRTELQLKQDFTYEMGLKYLGKSDEVIRSNGKFAWNTSGSAITLNGDNTQQFIVGENKLIKLDINGKAIDSKLVNNYQLMKSPADGITEKYWKLVELHGQPIKASAMREAHFILKNKDNRVQGNGGCNSFFGTYELQESVGRIRFLQMGSTMMACDGLENEIEFLKVLEMADNYSVNGDVLYLNKARMAPLAKLEAVYFK